MDFESKLILKNLNIFSNASTNSLFFINEDSCLNTWFTIITNQYNFGHKLTDEILDIISPYNDLQFPWYVTYHYMLV